MFNTASKINKREKIKRKEAIPKQKPTVHSNDDQSQDPSHSKDPWTVLQDSYLDEAAGKHKTLFFHSIKLLVCTQLIQNLKIGNLQVIVLIWMALSN